VSELERDLEATESKLCDEKACTELAVDDCKRLELLLEESSRCLEDSRWVFRVWGLGFVEFGVCCG
jgi:hypothetical protein